MIDITPTTAAELARDVYGARDPIQLKIFLAKKIFAPDPKSKTMLKAEVGGRLIAVTDGFLLYVLKVVKGMGTTFDRALYQ